VFDENTDSNRATRACKNFFIGQLCYMEKNTSGMRSEGQQYCEITNFRRKSLCLMAGRDGIEKTDILSEKYVQKLGELLV
jgi:hypothetical protein